MTDYKPLFERVDRVIQANIGLGDLLLVDNPETLIPLTWVRVEAWQTTLDGDIEIRGRVDQPTETTMRHLVNGQRVTVLASRVVEQIPAENITDVRLENFFADTVRDPSPEFVAAFNQMPGSNTYVLNANGELVEAVCFLGFDDDRPIFNARPDWIDVALHNGLLSVMEENQLVLGKMAISDGDYITRKASGTILPFPGEEFSECFTRFIENETSAQHDLSLADRFMAIGLGIEALGNAIEELSGKLDLLSERVNSILDDGK